jgi:hypothetical protein
MSRPALGQPHHPSGLPRLTLERPRDRLVEGRHALVGAFGDEPHLTPGPLRPTLRNFATRVPLDQAVDVLALELLTIGCGIVSSSRVTSSR